MSLETAIANINSNSKKEYTTIIEATKELILKNENEFNEKINKTTEEMEEKLNDLNNEITNHIEEKLSSDNTKKHLTAELEEKIDSIRSEFEQKIEETSYFKTINRMIIHSKIAEIDNIASKGKKPSNYGKERSLMRSSTYIKKFPTAINDEDIKGSF